MANLNELEEALIRADSAGDVDAAHTLAAAISEARAGGQQKETTSREKILGFPLTRLAMGAVSPLAGAVQLGAHTIGKGGKIDELLKEIEAEKQKGMQYWQEKTGLPVGPGTDIAGIVGSGLPFLPFAGAARGAGLLSKLARASGLGGIAGATAPVTEGDFATNKAAQTALGAVAGALPMAAGSAVGKAAEKASMLSPSKALTEYQKQLIGHENLPQVIAALKGAPRTIAGTEPTVAEAVSGIPAGSPLQAHQRLIAASPGGPSAEFGKSLASRQAAIKSAWEALNTATAPLRDSALNAANAKGGVPIPSIQASIFDISREAGIRSSPMAQRALENLRNAISSSSDGLRIDARNLYEIRKQLGDYIAMASKETASRDRKMLGTIERQIQKIIDDHIESAGGTGWKKYLDEYAKGASTIQKESESLKKMYKPTQRTSIPRMSSESGAEGFSHVIPKSAMLAAQIMKHLGRDIEPAMKAEAAKRYLSPQSMSQALESSPSQSEAWKKFLEASGILGAQSSVRQ